jgi:hypothetical protein
MEFNEFKNEILRRAKEAKACIEEYGRAYKSDNFSELMQVFKDNFNYAIRNKVIDPSLIEACKEQFNANQIYCNVSVTEGFLLACDNATVEAHDSATVKAHDNATIEAQNGVTVEAWASAIVRAWDSATVEAWDNVAVKAHDNATVEAQNGVTVEAWDNTYIASCHAIGCKLRDDAIYRIRESNTIRYASDNIKFEKYPLMSRKE